MMIRWTKCSLALVILSLTVSSLAQEQTADDTKSEQSRAAALVLFKEARALVRDGDFDAGCPKFEAALELWPSASTMINIAQCHEHYGRVASAWSAYKRAIVLNRETLGHERQKSLEELAQKGVDAMEPRLARLRVIIDAPQPAPADLSIRGGDITYPTAILEQPLPVDPGTITLTVTAAGYASASREVVLKEGATEQPHFSLVELAPPPPRAPPPLPPPLVVPPPLRPYPEPAPAAPEGVPTWAWISGAFGLAFAGVSIGFLVDDLDAISDLRDNCFTDDRDGATVCRTDPAPDNARKNRGFGLFLGFGIASLGALTAATIGIVDGMTPDGTGQVDAVLTPTGGALRVRY